MLALGCFVPGFAWMTEQRCWILQAPAHLSALGSVCLCGPAGSASGMNQTLIRDLEGADICGT